MTQQRLNTFNIDLHTHTWYSADSVTAPAQLVRRARGVGLDRIAVTDHGTIEGAREAQALDPELIIVGEEIGCAGGVELIGLYLSKHIDNGHTVETTALRIREQGGVVYVPHPFAYLRRSMARAEQLLRAADVVEVFNSRAFYPPWNRKARERAAALRLRTAISSDAHMPWELGRAYGIVPAFDSAAELLNALWKVQPCVRRRATPFIHALSMGIHLSRRAVGRGHGVPLRDVPS